MARTTDIKVGVFNFTNWPDKVIPPSFGDHSASVVDAFVESLDPESNARVVSLEVSGDTIAMVRRKRKPRVDETYVVAFDLYGTVTREKTVASVCAEPTFREYLREIVEAASGNTAFNTAAKSLIAGKVFATTKGL